MFYFWESLGYTRLFEFTGELTHDKTAQAYFHFFTHDDRDYDDCRIRLVVGDAENCKYGRSCGSHLLGAGCVYCLDCRLALC